MANSIPTTMDAPTRLSTDYIFVYVAKWVATTAETADAISNWGNSPLPNVTAHNSSSDANDEEWRHYGTGPQTDLDIIEYPVSLTLAASQEIDELGVLLGYAAGASKINLKGSTPVHIAQAGYTSAGVLKEVEYWSKVQWTSNGSNGTAGTTVSYKSYELSGKAESIKVTDGTGFVATSGAVRASAPATSASSKKQTKKKE